jgi:uncharacterized oxidoreductase
MPILSAEKLEKFAARLLEAAGRTLPSLRSGGCPAPEAAIVAGALVRANLAGHDSHGVIRLEQYYRLMRDGLIVPGAPLEIVTETPNTAVIDGHWGFGQVIARRATEIAIEKARASAVGVVSVRGSNHLGRLGDYPAMAAEQGMIALATVNNHGGGAWVAPWGGREGRLSTNPISIATPGPERPVLLDITTSVVAEGKIRVKRNRGERMPPGWAIDARGEPTTDPMDLYSQPRGAMLPFGGEVGHKGFALSLMVDILAGALSGAGCTRPDAPRVGNALFLLVIDVARMTPLDAFQERVRALVDYVRSAALAPGFSEILIPGEPEYRTEARRRRDGILVDDETWRQITNIAGSLRVALPEE